MFVRTIPESPLMKLSSAEKRTSLPALVPRFSFLSSGPPEAESRHPELDSAEPIRIKHELRAEKSISTLIGWFNKLLTLSFEMLRCWPLFGWFQRRGFWPADKSGPDQLELNDSENGWLRMAKLFLKLWLKNLFVL